MDSHNLSVEEIAIKLGSDLSRGLSKKKASLKLQEYGPNELQKPPPLSLWKLFFQQFAHLIIWILIGVSAISAMTGAFLNAVSILGIVFIDAFLGFTQELKAHKSIESLKNLSTPICKVIREGELQQLRTSLLVPGDLVFLEAGDVVPADGRVVNVTHFSTNEASLTGESHPVYKQVDPIEGFNIPLGDQKNRVFMGTHVASGKAHMIVTQTGKHAEFGKIASLLEEPKKNSSPLQRALTALGNRLILVCSIAVFVIFIANLLRHISFIESLLTATSLAVAAIPEGLPTIITLSLATGAFRLSKCRALIRHLPKIETLGCTSIICSDKTGTITKNAMHVEKVWTKGETVEEVVKIALYSSSAKIVKGTLIGDPTEGALLFASNTLKIAPPPPVDAEIPFDSERKRASFLRDHTLYMKGALETILPLCSYIKTKKGVEPLDEGFQKELLEASNSFTKEALRTLAVAYKEQRGSSLDISMEKELIFSGLIAMSDPPREEVKEAIAECYLAGINPIMMTGDHIETAIAIGKKIGMHSLKAVTGHHLDKLSEIEFKKCVQETSIFARISPAHKLRIVKAYKSLGKIVAVTGDGVNDAPAIKEADIGVAMGIQGTDVTKEVADMVITDDNFASIIHAIKEGRGIYNNIVKFINYLLSSNIAEMIVVFLAMLIGFQDPHHHFFIALSPLQILIINFITDGLPAIALTLDPTPKGAMQKGPRNPKEPILSSPLLLEILTVSTLIAIGSLIACYIGSKTSSELAQTMTFTSLVALELTRVQVIRAKEGISLFTNLWVFLAIALSILIHLAIVYLHPLQKIFGTTALNFGHWGIILSLTAIVYLISKILRFKKTT